MDDKNEIMNSEKEVQNESRAHQHHESHSSHRHSSVHRSKKTSKSKAVSELLIILFTVVAALLFVLLSPNTVAITASQTFDKWSAAAIALSIAACGGVLYLFGGRIFDSGEEKKKGLYRTFCELFSLCGIAFMLIVCCTTATVSPQPDTGNKNYVTKEELESYLGELEPGFTATSEDMVTINAPIGEIYLVNSAVRACMEEQTETAVKDIVVPYRNKGIRLDSAVAAQIPFRVDNSISETLRYFTVEVSKSEDFSSPRLITLNADARSVQIPYLETNEKYYIRITATGEENGVSKTYIATSSFRTARSPRILSISGIVNVRDIGGLETTDGKVVKQGMIIRGSEIDGAVKSDYLLSDEGIEVLKNIFGIRTDFDLRVYNEGNPLGVNHVCYNSPQYEGIFTEDGMKKIKNIFTDLSDPDTYPAYVHCTYGADRTGTVCYLLELVLGVKPAQAEFDYDLTGLYHTEISKAYLINITPTLETYEGKDLREKTENYLISCGVTAEQIASIRNILLEEQAD